MFFSQLLSQHSLALSSPSFYLNDVLLASVLAALLTSSYFLLTSSGVLRLISLPRSSFTCPSFSDKLASGEEPVREETAEEEKMEREYRVLRITESGSRWER